MQWLADNPIANMYGPTFLFFYAGVVLVTLLSCWAARRGLDWTQRMPPPAVPSAPDPHETAYLRGGENEVTRSVIFALIQKNLLSLEQSGEENVIGPTRERAERRALSPIERRALDWFAEPQLTSKIFKSDGLAAQLRPFCAAYEQRLRQERFLPTEDMKQRAQLLLSTGALVIVGLGGYKLIVALSRGRFNVVFLVLLGALGLVALFKVCRLPRQTKRGRVYLERLRTAFERLKTGPATIRTKELTSLGLTSSRAGLASAATAHSFDPTLPLLVGVFGVGALAGTQYDHFHQTFRRSAVSDEGSWAGASCGSCSSSDSSGGGSSCSSGGGCSSGCGGGCGGCGS